MKEKIIKLSILVEVMIAYEERQKIICFEKNEVERNKRFPVNRYKISYENMWNSLKGQLIDKVNSRGKVLR